MCFSEGMNQESAFMAQAEIPFHRKNASRPFLRHLIFWGAALLVLMDATGCAIASAFRKNAPMAKITNYQARSHVGKGRKGQGSQGRHCVSKNHLLLPVPRPDAPHTTEAPGIVPVSVLARAHTGISTCLCVARHPRRGELLRNLIYGGVYQEETALSDSSCKMIAAMAT